jgi:sugar/nucleoside kinase (ribokinase family)
MQAVVQIPVSLPAPADHAFDVVGLGLNSVDLLVELDAFPSPNSKQPLRRLARLPGGQTATALVTCARLGWRARYIGTFGDDENGRLGRESLIAEGVDIDGTVVVPGTPNQLAVILVDRQSGERTILFDRPAGLHIDPEWVPAAAVRSARVLLVDCHETAAATRAARLAREAGLATVIDVEKVRPGIDELLETIDIIIAAEEFPPALTGCPDLGLALRQLARQSGAAVVTATLGVRGSVTWSLGREIRTPAFPVPVVDTTGAGDVFRGGFIAGWLAAGTAAELEDVLRYASAVAALKCRALGARTGIPARRDVEALLAGAGASLSRGPVGLS